LLDLAAAVTRLCDELDQVWRAKIAAMPTVAARRLTVVRPSEAPSRGPNGSDDRRPLRDKPRVFHLEGMGEQSIFHDPFVHGVLVFPEQFRQIFGS
jgi:hypothetical protein